MHPYHIYFLGHHIHVLVRVVHILGSKANEYFAQLPLWALVTFGAYLLFKLGYGVFTFNDVPAAHAELMKEIEIARVDLRSKGVDVGDD